MSSSLCSALVLPEKIIMMLFTMLNSKDIVNEHLTKIIYVFELTILPVTANALSIIFADNHCMYTRMQIIINSCFFKDMIYTYGRDVYKLFIKIYQLCTACDCLFSDVNKISCDEK